MKFTILHLVGVLLVGIVVGILINRTRSEGFDGSTSCGNCNRPHPCGCDRPDPRPLCPSCPPCREPDMSKYVLKTTIPPCPPVPDMRNYILKTEVPPVPDLSNYVLKSSIPKPQPVLLDCSKCNKPKGECPPARDPDAPRSNALLRPSALRALLAPGRPAPPQLSSVRRKSRWMACVHSWRRSVIVALAWTKMFS